jgi:hypothetical protein
MIRAIKQAPHSKQASLVIKDRLELRPCLVFVARLVGGPLVEQIDEAQGPIEDCYRGTQSYAA